MKWNYWNVPLKNGIKIIDLSTPSGRTAAAWLDRQIKSNPSPLAWFQAREKGITPEEEIDLRAFAFDQSRKYAFLNSNEFAGDVRATVKSLMIDCYKDLTKQS